MDWIHIKLKAKKLNFKYLVLAVIFLIAAILIFFRFPLITDNTMEPTIKKGSRVAVLKHTNITKTHAVRGQIVAYRHSKNVAISRIVGLAGDSVRLIDNYLFVNDEKQTKLDQNDLRDQLFNLDDEISQFHLFKESLQPVDHWVLLDMSASFEKRNFPKDGKPLIVPSNSFLVMGDNRNLSIDTATWKIVNEKDIVGVPLNVKN